MLGNLGNIAKGLGDLAAANDYYDRALAIEERLAPDSPQVIGTLASIGTLADIQGDYISAKRYLLQATRNPAKSRSEFPVSGCRLEWTWPGSLHEGDFRKATEYKTQELALDRKLAPGGLDEAEVLGDLGEIAEKEKDFKAALQYQREALTISEKIAPNGELTVRILQNLGRIATEQESYESARAYYQRALQIQQSSANQPLAMALTLQGLGELSARTGQFEEASKFDTQALELLQKTLGPVHPDVARGLNKLAEIQVHTEGADKSFDTALRAETIGSAHLRLTMQGLSERQSLLYASERPVSLDLLLSLLGQKLQGDPERVQQAWSAVIRSRAMVLDEMAERHRAVRVGSDPDLILMENRLAGAKQRLANLTIQTKQDYSPEAYRKLLDRTQGEIEDLERSLSQQSSAFRERTKREQVGLPQVIAVLTGETALVAFVRYNSLNLDRLGSHGVPSYAAFVLPAQGAKPSFVTLASARNIENLWSEWNKAINQEAHATLPTVNSEIPYRQTALDSARLSGIRSLQNWARPTKFLSSPTGFCNWSISMRCRLKEDTTWSMNQGFSTTPPLNVT